MNFCNLGIGYHIGTLLVWYAMVHILTKTALDIFFFTYYHSFVQNWAVQGSTTWQTSWFWVVWGSFALQIGTDQSDMYT